MKKKTQNGCVCGIFAVLLALAFTACPEPEVPNQNPVASDFDIGNLTQTAGNVTPVTITPKAGKSTGMITIYYNGSTMLPATAGLYPVTFNVAAAEGFNAASGLSAGNLAIIQAAGTFGSPAAINTTYTPTLTLRNLSLPTGYAWNAPATSLNAGNGQQFPATYTDPSGNYEAANGIIIVNVAKASGTFGKPAAINTAYTPMQTLANLSLPTGYAWNTFAVSLNAGNGQQFPATYTDPSGNYEAANGIITVNVAKASGATVSRPTLNTRTHNSITVNSVTATNGQTVEYAINTVNSASSSAWESGATFTGLNAITTYYIFVRAAENGNYETGAASNSLSVTTAQAGENRVEYYWVDQYGSLVTTSGGATAVAVGWNLTIIAQGAGYTVMQWYLNGLNTGQNGITYTFSSTITGKYTVGLLVEKDGKLYNTNITITVQ
jgi:hypothetical protein